MLVPLSNNLLIKGTKEDAPKGFFIPETADKGRPTTGSVIAVGEGVKKVKAGQIVLIKGYMSDEIEIDKEKYLICQEDGVIGIIKE